jgi:acetyl esterase/lipase
MAFLHTADTAKTKVYSLYHWNEKAGAIRIVDTLTNGMIDGWCVGEYSNTRFSQDGTKLFFGTAPRPLPEFKDSLPDDEKVSVDVWKWDDPLIQPMQKIQADNERRRTYLAVYLLPEKKMVQLADETMEEVRTIQKGNGLLAAGFSYLPYRRQITWQSGETGEVFLVNVLTGKREKVFGASRNRVNLSPAGKYLYWYELADSNWYALSVEKKMKINFTGMIDACFYDVLMDMPQPSEPYGSAGWTADDKYILLYDQFDIWKIDPTFREKPVNLTAGIGKAGEVEYRYVDLDKENEFLPLSGKIYLHGFHVNNKKSGYFTADIGKASIPEALVFGEYSYSRLGKAKNDARLYWQRSNVEQYPDLWTGDGSMKEARKVSVTNPQQSNYLWGTVELVEWTSFDQQKLQGLLYKPENFDPTKKYPMIVYFYERMSDGLYSYGAPRPMSSSINRAYCVSNGYLFFIPDIPYVIGYPGESAFNAVVSGTKYLVDRYPFIDKDRLGIEGHSWGGYQTAYIITRTDMFRAAESGAPVSNMTSAYGGIRWESGMSRMFQYEESQSRIGGTLWEKPMHYYNNSPIFFVPKIHTPVLILHNDEDGAVPWYQGIEFYMALRRLDKPAWMLTYNGEGHGLRKWGNRVDFSIRMMQFFDHFLKDAPEPEWMKEGIPFLEKGRNKGLEWME